MLIGMGTPIQTLPISEAALREVNIIGVFRYMHTYPEAIEMLSGGIAKYPRLPDLSKLISHRFTGVRAVEDAFKMALRKTDDQGNLVRKVMINM